MVKGLLLGLVGLIVLGLVALSAPGDNSVKHVAQCYNKSGMITSCVYTEVTGIGK